MATSLRAPKQWCLTKIENVNSFENWRQNLLYTLLLDNEFAPFLVDGAAWEKKTRASPHRGFTDDGEDVPRPQRRTKEQKVSMLELMLGQIANYCPVISRQSIVKNSTSIDSIWQAIRQHYGFQCTGAHFIDFAAIKLEPNERPEDLFQRLMAFVEDNMLHKDSGISHMGEVVTEDEELSPSLENFIVLTWLRLLHEELPRLVKQRYGTELRSRTLASIKPEISQALDSLLNELQASEDARAMRTAVSEFSRSGSRFSSSRFSKPRQMSQGPRRRVCPLCKEARRADEHFLSKCPFLPPEDKKFMARTRQVTGELSESEGESDNFAGEEMTAASVVQRVVIKASPYLDTFHGHLAVRLTIDSGATGNMMKASCATRLGVTVTKTTQLAHQADGSSPLKVVGEVRTCFQRGGQNLYFEGLVVENLDSDILAGIPFMVKNDVSIRPAKHQVCVGENTYYYGNQHKGDRHAVRRAHVLSAPDKSTVWPGKYIELDLPADLCDVEGELAVEPHVDERHTHQWLAPALLQGVAGKIRVPNLTREPQLIQRHDHICRVRATFAPACEDVSLPAETPKNSLKPKSAPFAELVALDPDNIMSPAIRDKFLALHREFDSVFDPQFKGYNGAVGPFQANVNMGPVQPPQRKGRVPQYSRGQLQELQAQFDTLEQMGVFRKPEDVGAAVEYVNPSFLVKKAGGGSRLVTAFADVGRYSKPQPSLMPDVDSTLRLIAQWKYIIATDLTKAFYQIPLSRDSWKYCGVVTPFKGVRVYVRCAMGMPGSETALEELTCRVFGDLLEQGHIAKVADDMYCGANSLDDLLAVWRRVLSALQHCGLKLAATKTTVAPVQTSILGWVWRQGTIRATPHRVSALAACPPPKTVTEMRSFIGAYKVLARVLKNCATTLAPLDDVVAGRDSKDVIQWSDELLCAFSNSQKALSSAHAVTLPRPADQLWIVTDGAVRDPGLAATLYTTCKDTVKVAGYFSAKLRKNQASWLPCEVEALSIAAAVKHFAPYIIQSSQRTCVLTDSKPCVQAFEKLCRGEFSASPRVTSFLSTASRYQVHVRHVAGASILPSDFASRNAAECDNPTCQICTFVQVAAESVVRQVSTEDIMRGAQKLPFTSRSAWLAIQSECSDLRRTGAHLRQGTRPSKKLTNVRDVKRYLNVATLSRDGLLVVRRHTPLAASTECIVVPRAALDGLLTSLHIKLDHPSTHQLKTIVQRYFYALDMDASVQRVADGCHRCASLKKAPAFMLDQSTCHPPEVVGAAFAADVFRRERQFILVVRECVTSFTLTSIIENERSETLRDALLRLCVGVCPLDGPFAVVRTDPAPGFAALEGDEVLATHRLVVEVGRVKNINKNPVAERAIQELQGEILRIEPNCKAVTPLLLSVSTARLNSRVRSRGLAAREMMFQRDQFSHQQLPVDDQALIREQQTQRVANHPYSMRAKAPSGRAGAPVSLQPGDLVYLYGDRNKSRARDRYLVVSVDGAWCNIQKFTGNQLRRTSYRVRVSDCYKVRDQSPVTEPVDAGLSSDEDPVESLRGPDIPPAIAEPPLSPQYHGGTSADVPETCEMDQSVESVPPPEAEREVTVPRRSGRQTREPDRLRYYW